MAVRKDGFAWRLHPSQTSEALPVQGDLAQWVSGEPVPAPSRDALGYKTTSQADVRSHSQARVWLRGWCTQWEANQSKEPFYMVLRDEWAWQQYMANPEFQLHLNGEKVRTFGIAHSPFPTGEKACFWGVIEKDIGFMIQLTEKGYKWHHDLEGLDKTR